ncbi:ParB/RepB/Spo0J family partition protein [Candidatus Campbellbacteria bacterium]|nr:MAG: ParB/RepB/Spo0J family partition protein [Candidatus Campbellbacteria bacterium]
MKKLTEQIKTVKIKECVPNWWNPNEMNARQFASLKKAVTKFGQTKPIQVGIWPNMKVKGGYVIVGGYHTWKVLGELGNAEIEANVHEFKNEDEAKLYGLTDNIHGSNQQIKLGKLAYELTQNGHSIKDIAQSLGEEDVNVKDALDLVKDEIEKKMIELKKAERENFIVLNFIVDKDPKKSADDFIAAVTAFAKTKGVKVSKAVKDVNSQRETIALISFNVTNPQKNAVDEALSALTKSEKMTDSEAISEICGRFLLTLNDTKQH